MRIQTVKTELRQLTPSPSPTAVSLMATMSPDTHLIQRKTRSVFILFFYPDFCLHVFGFAAALFFSIFEQLYWGSWNDYRFFRLVTDLHKSCDDEFPFVGEQ